VGREDGRQGAANCIFYILTLAEPTFMTQMEVSEFTFTHSDNARNYIDLTKSDTLANCKGKSQFRNNKPLAYVFSARFSNPDNSLETIPTGWVQKNALVKTAAAWDRMNKKAGLSRKDLNTYGKEIRLAFDTTHKTNYAQDDWELVADGLVDEYTVTSEYDENGDNPVIFTIGPSVLPTNYHHAFDLTAITVPDPDGSRPTAISWQPHVIGDESSSVMSQYVTSRGTVQQEDVDLSTDEVVASDNYLTQMLSSNEETSDDVIENSRDHGDYRPYDLAEIVDYTTMSIAAGANVQGQDTVVCAPLGLLKWSGDDGDKLFLRLEAVIEM
tara:strand:- start:356 stop:1336 length:981 start_codon:yes stop_codon:yes gene_type:complete